MPNFYALNNFLIVESGSNQIGSIEIPDSAKEIGAPSGKIVHVCAYSRFKAGEVIFYDGSKAYRLKTSEGEYVAVKEEYVICTIDGNGDVRDEVINDLAFYEWERRQRNFMNLLPREQRDEINRHRLAGLTDKDVYLEMRKGLPDDQIKKLNLATFDLNGKLIQMNEPERFFK